MFVFVLFVTVYVQKLILNKRFNLPPQIIFPVFETSAH